MAPPLVSWGSIELLHNVIRTLDFLHERENQPLPVVTYRAKVKLHGTNAAVQSTAEGPYAQSRSKLLAVGADNKGFAHWMDVNRDYFAGLPQDITVFGEWCGPGVEKGMAISAIGRKVFAVFAIQDGRGEEATLETSPAKIRSRLPDHPDVFVIPWHGEPLTIDFSADLTEAVATINQHVVAVENMDPWVKTTFDVEGIGEGLVFYPEEQGNAPLRPDRFSLLAFKAKGEKHRTTRAKEAAQVSPEVAQSVEAFVDLVVTEARLEQGVVEACNGEFTMRMMGQFIRWVTDDVEKESTAELDAAELTWKQVAKQVSNRAREWYKTKSA